MAPLGRSLGMWISEWGEKPKPPFRMDGGAMEADCQRQGERGTEGGCDSKARNRKKLKCR